MDKASQESKSRSVLKEGNGERRDKCRNGGRWSRGQMEVEVSEGGREVLALGSESGHER